MLGAITGDIVGSVYEWNNLKSKDFPFLTDRCFYTDDSILTIALADAILTGVPYVQNLKIFYRWYPDGGYGGNFHRWAQSQYSEPYNSWGNGAAMRISPVGYAYDDLETVLAKAEEYTAVTHNHPEGIKGGQSVAAAIFLARSGQTKEEIRRYIEAHFSYDLSRHVDEIRAAYSFDVSCQGTVPQAIRAFLDSADFEDAVRTAISLGGDSDTLACITGGIAQAFYGGVPLPIMVVFLYLFKLGSIQSSMTDWLRLLGLLWRNMAKAVSPAPITPADRGAGQFQFVPPLNPPPAPPP